MEIRSFRPGDEAEQVAVFNAAAAALPGFKPATADEQRRRTRATGFDPHSRVYAVDGGQIVGYATFHNNGRVSMPWTLPGRESVRQPLWESLLQAMRTRGLSHAFAAYRGDWRQVAEFFLANGFTKTREMVNYVQRMTELPTMVNRRGMAVSRLEKADLPALKGMVPNLLQQPAEVLEKHFLSNPSFAAESVFVLRKADGTPQTVGILIHDDQFADPNKLDPLAPCYRLGAFGTELMSAKRVNGLFSFLAPNERDAHPLGLDLLWLATRRLDDSDLDSLAAQVPSDVSHLVSFYEKYFRRQGSFPVFEREI